VNQSQFEDLYMNKHLASLNPQQRRAVEYGIYRGNAKEVGPLLVIAGAGSGKTMAGSPAV
jgi:hypothetical protein